jgi:hypothetical protein
MRIPGMMRPAKIHRAVGARSARIQHAFENSGATVSRAVLESRAVDDHRTRGEALDYIGDSGLPSAGQHDGLLAVPLERRAGSNADFDGLRDSGGRLRLARTVLKPRRITARSFFGVEAEEPERTIRSKECMRISSPAALAAAVIE